MKKLTWLLITCCFFIQGQAQIKLSPDGRHLIYKNGKPFFWLGDTAWELFHRLNREEAVMYLKNRAEKGFTVIQAVALAEINGLNDPNPYGDRPLLNNNPATPNEAYFNHVDFIVHEAEKLGLLIAMLPSWGDKWKLLEKGNETGIFTSQNAEVYGRWLGKRYKDDAIVWVLGGDRNPTGMGEFEIIKSMVKGLKSGGGDQHLFTYHPYGGHSSSVVFNDDSWINMHMFQTGHSSLATDYTFNEIYFKSGFTKPHIDGEPRYEDHPDRGNPTENNWLTDFDARQAGYWNILSGGAGHTYGNNNIWQMYTKGRKPLGNARTSWQIAIDQPGSFQVGLMRRFFEKRDWQDLQPDQDIIIGSNPRNQRYKVAARSSRNAFMIVYIADGSETTISTAKLNAANLHAWWFNPRDGRSIDLGEFANEHTKTYQPLTVGIGTDWLLVVEDASKGFPDPGLY